jgi:hypothetical protein
MGDRMKDLLQQAKQPAATRPDMLTFHGFTKAEAEQPKEISGEDPLLKFVLNQWDMAASEVEEKAGVTIKDKPL